MAYFGTVIKNLIILKSITTLPILEKNTKKLHGWINKYPCIFIPEFLKGDPGPEKQLGVFFA